MKNVKFLLSALFMLGATATMAQQDFSDPKWAKYGDTPEAREKNILNINFLKEAVDNRNYDLAAFYFTELVRDCPTAQEATFQRGAQIYQAKINRSKSMAEKTVMIDSLMIVYDLRAQYFGDKAKNGRPYILDQKARAFLKNNPGNRAMIRQYFREAIEAGGSSTSPETLAVYFSNLCEDYKNTDEIMPDEIIAEYDRLSPYFAGNPAAAEFKSQFDAAFGLSGAASCENLERLFKARLAANPDDEATLSQAVSLMSRAKCESDFYFEVAEKYYAVKPSSETALFLAQAFQNKGVYDKAMKYLNESLAVETDPVEKQLLLVRIALVSLASNNTAEAASAAREARDLNPEDGVPYFILGQCYGVSAGSCSGFAGQAAFWAAYDTMAKAVELLPEDSEYMALAKQSLSAFRGRFPSSEECFFNELKEGDRYTVACGLASGTTTTVRPR